MSLGKQLLRNGVGIIIVKILGTLLAFVLSILLARSLGASGYGAYTFVLSLIMVLSIPIQAGFPNLAVRESSKALVTKNWSLVDDLWLWILRLTGLYFLLLCVCLLLFYYFNNSWMGMRYDLFLAGFILIPLGALTISQSSIIRGVGKIVLGSLFDGLIRFGISAAIIGGTLLFLPSYDITPLYAMIIYIVATFIAFLSSLLVLNKLINHNIRCKTKIYTESINWKKSLYPLTIVGGAQLLFGYADILVLGLFKSDEEVGIYRVMVQFSSLVVFGLTVLNQMLHPYFSRLYNEKNMEQLQKLVFISARVIFLFALLPAMAFIFYGENIVNYIYGKEYIYGIYALNILVIGQLLNASFGSVGALLNMTGHEKDSVKGMLIALIVNTILNFILIPLFGMEGAAVSTAIALIIWNVILRYYVRLRLNIESSGLLYSGYIKNKY